MNSGTRAVVHVPHGVDPERDLQVVAAQDGVVARKILGVAYTA